VETVAEKLKRERINRRRSSVVNNAGYIVLQCVAVCCSVMQSVAACCRVLQSVVVHKRGSTGGEVVWLTMQVTFCCSVLQCVAVCWVCCGVVYCVAACCRVLQSVIENEKGSTGVEVVWLILAMQVTVCCKVLQCDAA